MGIGFGFGFGFAVGGKGLIGSNVNPAYDPESNTDISTLLNTRIGGLLTGSKGTSANILTPAVYFTGNKSYFTIASSTLGITGGQPWDVTFKFKLDGLTRRNPLFYNGGQSAASRGITIMPYNSDLIIYSSNGTSTYATTVACGFADLTDYTLRFQWDGQTGSIVTITVNDTVFTTAQIYGWVGLPTGVNTAFGGYASAFYFKGTYKSIVGILGGVSLNFHPTGLNATSDYDLSVPDRKLTIQRVNGTTIYAADNYHYLDNGFSVQRKNLDGTTLMYFPNDNLGNTVDMTNFVGGGTTIIQKVSGSIYHNLWFSKIVPTQSFFDRSNVTIWNNTARTGMYNEAEPYEFDITEINLLTLTNMLNDGYRGMVYPKFEQTSVDDRILFKELILSSVDLKGIVKQKDILTYTNDIKRTQRYVNGDYYNDAQGYVKIYLYNDLGGDPIANYAYFQGLLDLGNATFAGKPYEAFAVKQPLKPISDSTVTINCEIRPKKATIANLTANVAINDVVYTVASTTGFNVGDQVIMTDNVARGGLTGGAERNFSNCGTITQLTATKITVDEPAKHVLLTAQEAKIGHFNTAILCDNITNVVIKGSGVINGNKTSQHVGDPVNSIGEEVKFGCGISVYNSTNVTIDGSLEIKNSPLHNIFVGTWEAIKSTGLVVKGIDAHHCRDKQILALNTDGLVINNVNLHDSAYEDGITLYLGNINFIIDGVVSIRNNRNAITTLANGVCNGTIKNVTTDGLINLSSSNIELENISIDGGYMMVQTNYGAVANISLLNVTMSNVDKTVVLQLLGALDNIIFNNLRIEDSKASTAIITATDYLANGLYPQDVEFHNGGIFDSTGTPTAINAGADVTFNNFAGL